MKPGKTENDIWIWRPSNFFQFYRRKDCFIVLGKNHLESIRKEVMEDYLNHHITLSGGTKKIFSDEAIFAIHQGSGGLLRKANSLAKTALLACAGDGGQTVSAEHVRIASTEIFM
jgi:general secretion pathway protein A